MIWDAELEHELTGLGKLKSYPGNTSLAHRVQKIPIIRSIISGEVDIHVHTASGKMHVCRCGPGEILGVHCNLHPEGGHNICWKTASDMECLEIPWAEVERLGRRSARVESILQNICQVRQYGIALATHPVFSCLPMQDRVRIFDNAIVRILNPGEHLICKHGARAHLYLLVSGKVDVRTGDQSVSLRGSGDMIGEMSLFGFSSGPTADVVAKQFSEIIEFLDADMLNIMQSNPEFRQRITALIESRTQAQACMQHLFDG